MANIGYFIGRAIAGIITLILISLAVSLAISNPDHIMVKLWPLSYQLTIPVWLVVLASFGMGLILGGLAMLMSLISNKLVQHRLNKRIKALEKEKLELSNEIEAKTASHETDNQTLLGS